ncbi:MAG: aldo/keto reductase [Propionibacteriaceae bacterium]|nr:aldo/keto reductase [Propionibacteriaceae bacterium]
MKTFPMPGTDLTVPPVVLGTMRIDTLDDEAIRTLFNTALDEGVNFFDHAAFYGPAPHACETRFAQAMKLTPAQRDGIILQTKCGIVSGDQGTRFDFSYEEITASAEASLKALDTDHIDILLLHRPDALVEPDEVARAFDELQAAGKVRWFGVSNHTPAQIELLKKSVTQPLVANQIQISLTHCPSIAQGVGANMSWAEQSVDRDGGMVDYARLNDITLQAWSPFQNPDWSGTFIGNPDQPELNAVLTRLAAQYGTTPTGIATAWLTRHPARMQVVAGTMNPARLKEIVQGSNVALTKADWYELFVAAGHIVP